MYVDQFHDLCNRVYSFQIVALVVDRNTKFTMLPATYFFIYLFK